MSGHSRFADIEHERECNNAARGKIFTVTDRKIIVAVREGGAGSVNNNKLRDVITKAKANNTPSNTIDHGTKKATGDTNSIDYEIPTCGGYDPSGIVIIVDTLTDNENCTAANVGSAFTKGGGDVGTPGSVSYMFSKKGQIIINKGECDVDPDELTMFALDAGVEDFSGGEDSYEVVMMPKGFSAVREALEAQSIPMVQADVTVTPQT